MPGMIYLIYRYLIHPFFSFIYCFITLHWPEGAAVRKVNRLGIIISFGEHHKSMCADEQIGKRRTDGLYANKFTVRREGHLERHVYVCAQEENTNIFNCVQPRALNLSHGDLQSCRVKFQPLISWMSIVWLDLEVNSAGTQITRKALSIGWLNADMVKEQSYWIHLQTILFFLFQRICCIH